MTYDRYDETEVSRRFDEAERYKWAFIEYQKARKAVWASFRSKQGALWRDYSLACARQATLLDEAMEVSHSQKELERIRAVLVTAEESVARTREAWFGFDASLDRAAAKAADDALVVPETSLLTSKNGSVVRCAKSGLPIWADEDVLWDNHEDEAFLRSSLGLPPSARSLARATMAKGGDDTLPIEIGTA